MGVRREESQSPAEGQEWGPGPRWRRGQAAIQQPGRRAQAGGRWASRARDLPGAPRPLDLPSWAPWTCSSRSHQPDSPRGRLRRQTAVHRAPPPAPAPQPACAIALPPARSLPRAISRFQGRCTFLSSRRAPTGPRNPYRESSARSTPQPQSPGLQSHLFRFPGPKSPGAPAVNWALRAPPRPLAGVTQGPRGPAPGEGVMTSRRPGQGPGYWGEPGRRHSDEGPPPVASGSSVPLRAPEVS